MITIKRDKNGRFVKGVPFHSEQTKKKIAKSHIGIGSGVSLSEKHRKSISDANKGKNRGEKNGNWRGGISIFNNVYSDNWTSFFRWSIRKRDNFICQECGKNQIEEDKIFPIHHIDYNKLNDNPINLITLCNSCHGKTTYTKKMEYFKDRYSKLQENRFKMK
jgi:uncharacterized protein YozE (UPF0346 family)